MHPCITQSREQLRAALYEENAITEMLQNWEKYTGISRSLLVTFLTVFIVLYMLAGYGVELVCTAIIFFLPAYFTLLSINGTSDSQKKWLSYWIIFTVFTVMEFFLKCHLRRFPLYWLVKLLIMSWCFFPIDYNGSLLFNKYVIEKLSPFLILKGQMETTPERKESKESVLSFSEDAEKQGSDDDTLSEKETLADIIAEKKAKGETIHSKTSSFFGKSFLTKTKSDEPEKERSSKPGFIKSATTSLFGGKNVSFFTRKKKEAERSESSSDALAAPNPFKVAKQSIVFEKKEDIEEAETKSMASREESAGENEGSASGSIKEGEPAIEESSLDDSTIIGGQEQEIPEEDVASEQPPELPEVEIEGEGENMEQEVADESQPHEAEDEKDVDMQEIEDDGNLQFEDATSEITGEVEEAIDQETESEGRLSIITDETVERRN